MKILVIEDNVFYQSLFEKYFEDKGLEVTIASHGAVGLDEFAGQVFSHVFVDVNLPDMPGVEVLGALISEESTAKIVVISGNPVPTKGFDSGENHSPHFLPKPFQSIDLDELFPEFCNKNASEKSAEKSVDPSRVEDITGIVGFAEQVGHEFCIDLVEMFLKELDSKVPSLSLFLVQDRVSEIESYVHQLKSNSRYLGFEVFGQVCEDIEHKASSGKTDDLAGLICDLEGHLDHVKGTAIKAKTHLQAEIG